jgi:glycosyltransferase involved in cell wall biosynthesis
LRRHRPDVVHAHDLYSNQFTIAAARAARVRIAIASRRWWEAGIETRARRTAHRLGCGLAHRVLANSSAIGRRLVAEEGVRPDRVAIVPNFLDESSFDALGSEARVLWRERHGIGDRDTVIGIVANLNPVKDHITLVRATALLPRGRDFRIVLVGKGAMRDEIASEAARLGVSHRIVFAGASEPGPNQHRYFDVSVLCSTSEGSPNSVIEAMAAARPVVATAVGGTPELVVDGETGLLVPPRDAAALAAALTRLLEAPDLGEQLGRHGRERALANHAAEHVLTRLLSLYRKMPLNAAARVETAPAEPALGPGPSRTAQ